MDRQHINTFSMPIHPSAIIESSITLNSSEIKWGKHSTGYETLSTHSKAVSFLLLSFFFFQSHFPFPHSYILLPKLGSFARLVKSFLLLMSIYSLARATSNLFLLITHNFQVVWPTQRLAPCCVCSEECCDCLLFIYLFILLTYTSRHPSFSANPIFCVFHE